MQSLVSEICSFSRADVGIGPYGTPANSYCLANFEYKAFLPQILNRSCLQIRCPVTGGV